MKQPQRPIIYNLLGFLLFILILVAIGCLIILHQDGTKCLANPIKYGVNSLASQNKENVMCSCNGLNKFTTPIIYQSNVSLK